MKHDCSFGYLETSEDDEGYLYLEWKKAFGTNTGKFKIEFCPVCGTKAKKSHVADMTMYPREDRSPLETMHGHIMEMFDSACQALKIDSELDEHSFKFCSDTIVHTLNYLRAKRKE